MLRLVVLVWGTVVGFCGRAWFTTVYHFFVRRSALLSCDLRYGRSKEHKGSCVGLLGLTRLGLRRIR